MTRVVFNKPHTHAGIPHVPNDTATVDASDAAWLIEHDIAHIDKASFAKPAARRGTLPTEETDHADE